MAKELPRASSPLWRPRRQSPGPGSPTSPMSPRSPLSGRGVGGLSSIGSPRSPLTHGSVSDTSANDDNGDWSGAYWKAAKEHEDDLNRRSIWESGSFFLLHKTDQRIWRLNVASLVVAVVGICLMMAEIEILWHDNNRKSWRTNTLKLFISLTTIVLLGLVTAYYTTVVKAMRLTNKSVLPGATIWQTGLWPFWLLEMFVCGLHVPPWVNILVERDFQGEVIQLHVDAAGIFMFLRLYLVVRVLRDNSVLRSVAGRFIGAARNERFNSWFAIKSLMKYKPFTFLITCTTLYILVASWTVHVCERFYEPAFRYWPNSLWVILVTMTTVGYGDIDMVTTCGRGVAVSVAALGLIISALLVTILTQKLSLNRLETKIVTLIKKNQVQPALENGAANIIIAAWRYFKQPLAERRNGKASTALNRAIERQRHHRRELHNLLSFEAVTTELEPIVKDATSTIAELREEMHAVDRKVMRLNAMLSYIVRGSAEQRERLTDSRHALDRALQGFSAAAARAKKKESYDTNLPW